MEAEEYIACPICNMKMHKIFIANFNSHIDVCPTCCGIFFDYNEFEYIEDENKPTEELDDFFSKMDYIQNIQTPNVVYCPKCKNKMIEVSKRRTELYECSSCLAKFADKQTIDKYRKEYTKDEKIVDNIKEMFVAKNSIDLLFKLFG